MIFTFTLLTGLYCQVWLWKSYLAFFLLFLWYLMNWFLLFSSLFFFLFLLSQISLRAICKTSNGMSALTSWLWDSNGLPLVPGNLLSVRDQNGLTGRCSVTHPRWQRWRLRERNHDTVQEGSVDQGRAGTLSHTHTRIHFLFYYKNVTVIPCSYWEKGIIKLKLVMKTCIIAKGLHLHIFCTQLTRILKNIPFVAAHVFMCLLVQRPAKAT